MRGKKGTHAKLISGLTAEGFARVRIDGDVRELADNIELDKNQSHNIEVVVDRLIARDGIQERLTDSLCTALKRGDEEDTTATKGKHCAGLHFARMSATTPIVDVEIHLGSYLESH